MISRFKHVSAFERFLEEDADTTTSILMKEDASTPDAPPQSLYFNMVGKSSIITDTVLISFLPEWIKQEAFCKLMDILLSQLISASTLTSKTPVHRRAGFASFFAETPP